MADLAQLVPLAAGVVISPLPIVAVVALLLSPRGRGNGLAFAAANTGIGFAVTLVAALGTAGAGAGGGHGDEFIVLGVTGLLAIGFAVLALLSWRGRPRGDAPPKPPGWLAAVDALTPARAAGLGVLMAVTNSKNLPLELKAGAIIGAHDLAPIAVVGLAALFALGAGLGVILPTALAATGAPAITAGLGRLKEEMIRHNAWIMTVLFAVLAAVEIASLIHQLTNLPGGAA
ncbi:GAP family protein [Agromyces mediolanus]|uniref:GAP family protein n=1 Tax=Agromyces mediolanus TaxID=41986 RepID=UPI003834F620